MHTLSAPLPAPFVEDEPEPLVRIELLGRVRMRVREQRLDARLSGWAVLLLAMLVVDDGAVVSREELAFRLWPDMRESDARASLRRHLYHVQRALPAGNAWLQCDARSVAWAVREQTWIDVLAFERLCDDAATLASAAALYRGAFAPMFDHAWVISMRERMQQLITTALERLVRERTAVGDTFEALHYLRRLLELDPWREDLVRESMRLRFQAHDRAGALASYRAFRTRLRDEFDVEPLPETIACYDAIAGARATC